MGMTGYFLAAAPEEIQQVQRGDLPVSRLIYRPNQKKLDVDKTWHAIHYLLSNKLAKDDEDILCRVVFSRPVSQEDLGMGPATFLTSDEVKQAAESLSQIQMEQFRQVFDLKEMLREEIYPVMENDVEEEFFQYVWDGFQSLRMFFQPAGRGKVCIVLFIIRKKIPRFSFDGNLGIFNERIFKPAEEGRCRWELASVRCP